MQLPPATAASAADPVATGREAADSVAAGPVDAAPLVAGASASAPPVAGPADPAATAAAPAAGLRAPAGGPPSSAPKAAGRRAPVISLIGTGPPAPGASLTSGEDVASSTSPQSPPRIPAIRMDQASTCVLEVRICSSHRNFSGGFSFSWSIDLHVITTMKGFVDAISAQCGYN
ncbi:atherin [Triticum aestivum]|uniref:atherin n=1 Tax=Triticum aestivum TaxID=4565 RepID=UPI001D0321A2|nr:atherin-like [Triticum aestivum]